MRVLVFFSLLIILGSTLSPKQASSSIATAWRPPSTSIPVHSENGWSTVAAITTLPVPTKKEGRKKENLNGTVQRKFEGLVIWKMKGNEKVKE